MKKCYKTILLIFIVFGISSCATSKQSYPDDERFQAWRIGIVAPYEFPVFVREAYGVNYTEDWTSLMLRFAQLNSAYRRNMERIRKYTHSEYDGYGLPLSVPNLTGAQIGLGVKTLPDEVYIYWGLYNSMVEYATVVEITPQIKAAMTKPYLHPWLAEQNCYQVRFIFGLLPDGRAKLWLKGCSIYTYVGEYQPTKVMPPTDPSLVNNKPVPWDKVNKIWYNKEVYRMQNLEDVVPLSALP